MLHTQVIELQLDGITAGDYIAHAVDAAPQFEGTRLRSVAVDADPLGDSVSASLRWDGPPPAAKVAAAVAGLHLTADVAEISSRVSVPVPRRLRRPAPSLRPVAQAA